MTYKIINEEFEKILSSLELPIEKMKNKSILITGASGLIGSYVIYFLKYINNVYNLNIKIFAMSRSKEKLKQIFENSSDIVYVEQNLNKSLKENIDCNYIIHAASNAHPLAFSSDPVGTMKTNFIGTMNLLDLAIKTKAKLLYISTGEIYGNNVDHAFTENDLGIVDTKIPRSCYPESKRAAETLCMSYNDQYGVDVNVARLCYIYGGTITETNSRADAQFLRNAIEGKDIVLKSEGAQRRTYCYVADAVSAILMILLKGEKAAVYNIANQDSIVSVKEYAQTLAELAGVNLKFELPNKDEAKGFSKPADSILDSTKLQSLGWKPFFNIIEGLKRTLEIKRKLC